MSANEKSNGTPPPLPSPRALSTAAEARVPPRAKNAAAPASKRKARAAPQKLSHSDEPRTAHAGTSLPHILLIHCGGTFGMDTVSSFDASGTLRRGGNYKTGLRPGPLLANILDNFPELRSLATFQVNVPLNLDSSRLGPPHWIKLAKLLDRNRDNFDGFVIIHGTDTMSYTASALSLMLAGFRKPVVFTGSQIPMAMPRSDARQNLVDAVTVACADQLQEFALCFGGTLLRANRALKTKSSAYRAFSSPTYPPLATLGVDIEWDFSALWKDPGVYRPRIKLERNVVRIPVVPGLRPQIGYGDLVARGVRGAVIEAFGVGNLPDQKSAGWMDWFKDQREKGLELYLASQCLTGPLNPALYRSGSTAMKFGATTTRRMTAETAVVKMMLCLAYTDLHLSYPLAGEL
ncbi:unnamed protein product [Chondrus crispus]|uniref:asparaginase n=1 Tax=Chondrus crispus TaxID=2769 RepID=R7Q8Z1_CHOCR|nr:unnamed protein product [Chondrus crispus]CDF33866.1 unnamed protein product [Chondrus crispus]|eukprot:XP_005713685.1 unnamed protein product [Chondrus crispus]